MSIQLKAVMGALGRGIPYYPRLAAVVGVKESILLSQLLYWTPRSKNVDGWFYKSAEELLEETGLSYKEQWRARAELKVRGLIEERHDREEHRIYFRVIETTIDALLDPPEAPPSEVVPPSKEVAPPSKTEGEHLPNGKVPPSKTEGTTFQNGRSLYSNDYTMTTQRLHTKTSQPAVADVPVVPGRKQFIFDAYPRREGSGAGVKAIGEAIERIRRGEGMIPPIPDWNDAYNYLHKRTLSYARSPAGSSGNHKIVPHPATWYNESRYLDDESNWQFTGEENNGRAKTSGNLAAARAAFRNLEMSGDFGRGSSSGDNSADIRGLLKGD
jgi:hypothetical protein